MSLVQEALKRKNEEEREKAAASPSSTSPNRADAPKTPDGASYSPTTPLVDTSGSMHERKTSRSLLTLLLLLAILSALAYTIYLYYFDRNDEPVLAREPVAEAPRPAAPEPEPVPAQVEPAEVPSPEPPREEVPKDPEPEPPAEPEPLPEPEAPPRSAEPSPEPTPEITPAPKPTPEPPPQPEPARPEQVAWPRLHLQGVLVQRNRPTEGTAILNDRHVRGGQTIEGVRLVSVHPDGVILQLQEEVRTLRVGAETF